MWKLIKKLVIDAYYAFLAPATNSEEMKLFVKLCGDACDSLCKGDALLASLDLDD